MSELTPGPWEIVEAYVDPYGKDDVEGAAVYHVYPVGNRQNYIAEVGKYSPNAQGNVRGISKVPQLIDALENLIEGHKDVCPPARRGQDVTMNIAVAVLEAAKGERA